MNAVKSITVSLLSSKKVLTAIAGVLTLLAIRFVPGVSEETIAPLSLQITSIAATTILGIGAADFGKEAKKTETEAGAKAVSDLLGK